MNMEHNSKAWWEGYAHALRHGSFSNNNPYCPLWMRVSHQEWEEGYQHGRQSGEWL